MAGLYFALARDRESEADYIGLVLMADAGFDPSAAATMWRRMTIIEENRLRELKRQHPEIDEARLKAILQEGQDLSTHPHVSFCTPCYGIPDNLILTPNADCVTDNRKREMGTRSTAHCWKIGPTSRPDSEASYESQV